jgi:hypothetical protein
VNAVAQTTTTQQAPIRVKAEHISLETRDNGLGDYLSDTQADGLLQPRKRQVRKVRCDYALESKLRGCVTKLALLEDHFLSVQLVRPDIEPKNTNSIYGSRTRSP